MHDKSFIEISEELHLYIEALVEEVVLEGKPFENHKHYLRRFSEAEGIDYEILEKKLRSLFSTAEKIKHHDSTLEQFTHPAISGWSKDFIEQIREAYCNKDTSYLEDVFSPKASIITGAFVPGKDIRYRTQGKRQYMTNLRYIFAKNKKIDVEFETDKMTGVLFESAEGKCQIVRLLQRWTSDNYNDIGYLSLLLFYTQEGPKVYLRAWQPINH